MKFDVLKKKAALAAAIAVLVASVSGCSSSSDMTGVRKALESVSNDEALTAFGKKQPSDESMNALNDEIKKLENGEFDVSLVMVDLNTRSGVSYCSDRKMCTQSTIKAVYLGSLLESAPDSFEPNKEYFQQAIELSDNDAYMKLRKEYGNAPLINWCINAGVDQGFAAKEFPRSYTAMDMCMIWTEMYRYLNSSSAPEEFKDYLSNTINSAAHDVLGKQFTVLSKAGWENGLEQGTNYPTDGFPEDFVDKVPDNDEAAINDTGVVYTDKGAYIFVIYTDIPFGKYSDYEQENPLYAVTTALFNVQRSIAG